MTSVGARWRAARARYQQLRERRWFRWAVDLAVLAAIVLGLSAWQTRNLLARGAAVELSLPTLRGETVSFAQLRGKPVLVSLWAPWCGVCTQVAPNVERVQSLVGDRAHVVSIAASWTDVAQVQAFVQKEGVTYPVLLGGERELAMFRLSAFPTLYFLDAEGRVKSAAVGYTTTAGLLVRLFL